MFRSIFIASMLFLMSCSIVSAEIPTADQQAAVTSNATVTADTAAAPEAVTVNSPEAVPSKAPKNGDQGKVILLDAGQPVLNKRLPTPYGLKAGILPFKTYTGTSADITRLGPETFDNVLGTIEGISQYNDTGSEVDQKIVMRGFTKGQEVAVLLDGVRYNDADDNSILWYYLPLEAIDRYEVIKGSNSSIYGSGGFAGTVHLYRQKNIRPFLKLEAGGLGYNEQALGTGWQNGPLFGSIIYDHKAAEGFRRFDDYDLNNLDLTQGIFLNEERTRSIAFGFQQASGFTNYSDSLTEDELRHDRAMAIAGDRRRTNEQIATLRYADQLTTELSFQTVYNSKWSQINYTGISRSGTRTRAISDRSGNGITLQTDWHKDLVLSDENWSFGLEQQLNSYDNRDYALNVDWVKTAKNTDSGISRIEKAYFANYSGTLADHLVFDLGSRQDQTELYWQNFLKPRSIDSADFSQRSHHAGLFWKVAEDSGFFTGYSEAFKAPSVYDLFPLDRTWTLANSSLEPELARTTESGVRWAFGRKLKAEASVYRTEVENEIALVETSTPGPFGPGFGNMMQNRNVQKTSRRGIELSLRQALTDTLAWHLGYTTCEARFEDTEGGKWDGKVIPMVPAENWNADLEWEFMSNYTMDIFYRKIGPQYLSYDEYNDYDHMPAYNLTDLKLSYKEGSYIIYGMIKNLFNEMYETRGINAFTSVDGTWDWYQFYDPAPMRTAEVGMKVIF